VLPAGRRSGRTGGVEVARTIDVNLRQQAGLQWMRRPKSFGAVLEPSLALGSPNCLNGRPLIESGGKKFQESDMAAPPSTLSALLPKAAVPRVPVRESVRAENARREECASIGDRDFNIHIWMVQTGLAAEGVFALRPLCASRAAPVTVGGTCSSKSAHAAPIRGRLPSATSGFM